MGLSTAHKIEMEQDSMLPHRLQRKKHSGDAYAYVQELDDCAALGGHCHDGLHDLLARVFPLVHQPP